MIQGNMRNAYSRLTTALSHALLVREREQRSRSEHVWQLSDQGFSCILRSCIKIQSYTSEGKGLNAARLGAFPDDLVWAGYLNGAAIREGGRLCAEE